MSRKRAIPLILSIMALNLIFVSNYKITLVDIENANMSLVEQNKGIPNRKAEFTTTKIGNLDKVWVTHYCSCIKCTGVEHNPNNVYGAMGVTLTPMVSVASNEYKLGTRLLVTHSDGKQEIWIVQDRGGMGRGHLDLYVGNNHQLALSIPNEYVNIEVI